MADLVSAEEIEGIVGAERHATEHWGRAVSSEQTVYILHSRECLNSRIDLPACPYTVALDRGIDSTIPWSGWRHVQDRPVALELFRDYLVPARHEVKASLRAALDSEG